MDRPFALMHRAAGGWGWWPTWNWANALSGMGTVDLSGWDAFAAGRRGLRRRLRGGRDAAHLGPRLEGARPGGAIPDGGDVVAAEMEEVADLVVGREEALRLPGRLEALHLPFSSPRRLVRVLRPVVQALVPAVLDTGHQVPLRRAVAGELAGDHDAWRSALALEQLAQQALGGPLVPAALDQRVEHHPGLVDRTPEPVPHTGDPDGHLIQVPLVPGAGQPPPDPVGEVLAELERPPPHGLVADDDAAGGQHLLDHAQAQREAEVQPHRVADDLGREAVAGIGRLGRWWAHSGCLPDRGQPAKPDPS